MNTRLFFCTLLLCLTLYEWVQGQSRLPDIPEPHPKEFIALHINTTFFLAGETLLFKVYCFDQLADSLSTFSTVAYVELIGQDQQPFAQMKIKLKGGTGNGDFFFPGNTPSGNYTLIAYTRWMRNFHHSGFFHKNITVINPAIPPPSSQSVSSPESFKDTIHLSNPKSKPGIRLSKSEYGQREKVTVTFAPDSIPLAALSVSVRSLDAMLSSRDFSEASNPGSSWVPGSRFLPDLRGEVISGAVTSSEGAPLAGRLVSLSSPSKDFEFMMSTTDSTGRYYFSVNSITSPFILLDVLNGREDNVTIHNDNSFIGSYEQFTPPKLVPDTTMREEIAKRFLSLQIENAFYSMKNDSVKGTGDFRKFFTPDKVYALDDFTRFPTMDDVLREIITEVSVRMRNGNYSMVMLNSASGFLFPNPPLVLVDGIPVEDANVIMKYDPMLIRTISLVTRHYFYGGLEADGIISIETYEGDAKDLPVTRMTRVSYITPQPCKVYYSPGYDGSKDLSRIPDFRTQLYWNPSVDLEAGVAGPLIFFTGDLDGPHFIEAMGITLSGERIYWRKEFVVR